MSLCGCPFPREGRRSIERDASRGLVAGFAKNIQGLSRAVIIYYMTLWIRDLMPIEVCVRCRDEYRLDEGESAAMALALEGDRYFATTDSAAFVAAITELGQ